jgi:hypothetical protein
VQKVIYIISILRYLKNFFQIFNDLIWLIVFNAIFNSISAISWRPVLMVEEAEVLEENHRPKASNW